MLLRKYGFVSLCIAISLLLGWYATHSTQTPQTPAIPGYIQEVVDSTWQTFTPENGAFELLFPVAPQHVTKKVPFGSTSEQVIYNVYSALGVDGTRYLLSSAEYPAQFDTSDPTTILNKLLQELTNGRPANELIGQTPTTFNGFTAIDFDLQNVQFATLGKAIVANKTLYVLTVMNPDRNNLEKNFHAFTNSFKIH